MADKNTEKTNINSPIGYVVGGGLKANLHIRLTVPAFSVQEGSFIVIKSGNWQFYSIATDLQLGATDPRFADDKMETAFHPISCHFFRVRHCIQTWWFSHL